MFKSILALVLALSIACAPKPAPDLAPSSVWTSLAASIQPLGGGDGGVFCTAFGVMDERFLSAAHCVKGEAVLLLAGEPAQVIKIDVDRDLVLLAAYVPAWNLTLARRAPRTGERLRTIGYGLGLGQPMAWEGIVSVPSIKMPGYGEDELLLTVPNTTQGFSGSPVVNDRGELVGVTKGGGHAGGPAHIFGAKIRWEAVKEFLR